MSTTNAIVCPPVVLYSQSQSPPHPQQHQQHQHQQQHQHNSIHYISPGPPPPQHYKPHASALGQSHVLVSPLGVGGVGGQSSVVSPLGHICYTSPVFGSFPQQQQQQQGSASNASQISLRWDHAGDDDDVTANWMALNLTFSVFVHFPPVSNSFFQLFSRFRCYLTLVVFFIQKLISSGFVFGFSFSRFRGFLSDAFSLIQLITHSMLHFLDIFVYNFLHFNCMLSHHHC